MEAAGRGLLAGISATLLLSALARVLPGMRNQPEGASGGGRRPPPADPFDKQLVRAWQRTYGLPAIVINCGNNYGPWQFPEKLIPLMILNAVEGRELPVYGDGLQVRDWVHVADHCRAIEAVVEKGEVGRTYLVGGDDPRTNLDVVERICRAVDAALARAPGT